MAETQSDIEVTSSSVWKNVTGVTQAFSTPEIQNKTGGTVLLYVSSSNAAPDDALTDGIYVYAGQTTVIYEIGTGEIWAKAVNGYAKISIREIGS